MEHRTRQTRDLQARGDPLENKNVGRLRLPQAKKTIAFTPFVLRLVRPSLACRILCSSPETQLCSFLRLRRDRRSFLLAIQKKRHHFVEELLEAVPISFTPLVVQRHAAFDFHQVGDVAIDRVVPLGGESRHLVCSTYA